MTHSDYYIKPQDLG